MNPHNTFQLVRLARNLTVRVSLAALLWLLPFAAQGQAIEAWVQRFDGTRPGDGTGLHSALAVDANGNVIVTCSSYSGDPANGYDWVTIKYSGAGLPLWTNRYNEPGNVRDWPNALAVDTSGNVFVTGLTYNLRNYCTTVKYSPAGTPLWTRQVGSGSSGGQALAVDASGNVIVTASSAGTNSDILTIKYSSTGAQLWSRGYNGPANDDDNPSAVAVDASDNVYVAGLSQSPIGGTGCVLIKYSSAGVPLWTRFYTKPNMESMAVDHSGNVVVTSSRGGNSDYATIKFSSAGTPLWTNFYNGPANASDWAWAVAVDDSDNVYVTGSSEGIGTRLDYATIKYSSAGVPLWTNRYNGPANDSDNTKALAVDASGNVFVTGFSFASGYETVAYSSSGVPLWSNLYHGSGTNDDISSAVAVDANGGVYVAGHSRGSDGGVDLALVKYVVPPIITLQPLSRTNAVGTAASFTVEAVGPFTYQWRRDGANLVDGGKISGVTTTNLLVANVQTGDAGGYTVVVTNAYGSATSHVAQLTVYVPPNPGRFTNLAYSPETGVSFIFRDGTLGRPYRIQTSASLAAGSWVDWQSFTYNGPAGFMDVGATGAERRFYRAVSP